MTTTYAPVVSESQTGLFQALILIDRKQTDSELEVLEIGAPVEVHADAYRMAIIEASRRYGEDDESSADATRVETTNEVGNPQLPTLTLLNARNASQKTAFAWHGRPHRDAPGTSS